jgi:hypothetical protein
MGYYIMLDQPKDLKVHFIGFGPKTLGLDSYIAVKSAANIYNIKPIFWGMDIDIWFKRIQEIAKIEVVPNITKEFTSTLEYLAQKADYIRYWALANYGGLYLDSDTVCVKSIFTMPELNSGITIATEQITHAVEGGTMYSDEPFNIDMFKILKECHTRMLKQEVVCYSEYGPVLLTNLALSDMKINVIDPYYCDFYPWQLWQKWFDDNVDLDERIYIIHWWGKNARPTVQSLTSEYLINSSSFFAQAVRKSLKDDPYVFSMG